MGSRVRQNLHLGQWPLHSAVVLAVLLNGGCAVNDLGLVRVRRFQNESAYVVSLESWGAHLLTAAGDAGLTIGWTRRVYVFPRAESDVAVPLDVLTDEDKLKPTPCESCPPIWTLGDPVFHAGTTVGATIDTNRRRMGSSLGYSQRAAIELPADGTTVMVLRYRPGSVPQVIIGREIKR